MDSRTFAVWGSEAESRRLRALEHEPWTQFVEPMPIGRADCRMRHQDGREDACRYLAADPLPESRP